MSWRRGLHSFMALVLLALLVPQVAPRKMVVSPSTFRSVPTTVRDRENSSVVLPCQVDALGSATVQWLRNDEVLAERSALHASPRRSRVLSRATLRTDNSLLVEGLLAEDAGEYVCQVLRPAPWPPIRQTHAIEVLFPASAALVPDTASLLTVQLGQSVDVTCEALGVPTPIVTWSRIDQTTGEEQRLEFGPRLSFSVLSRLEAGEYRCEALNDVGSPASAAFLLVVQHVPEVKAEKSWIHTSLGLKAELTCLVKSEPDAQVEWFRRSPLHEGSGSGELDETHELQRVETSSRVTRLVYGERHSLVLRAVRLADLANYTCRATNLMGVAEDTMQLSGLANPAIVKGDLTVATENNYTLIWDVDSSSPVFEYLLKFRKTNGGPWRELTVPAGSSRSTPLHSLAFALSGLESATKYEAIVCARNRFGWNKPSAVFFFVTPGAGEIATESPSTILELPSLVESAPPAEIFTASSSANVFQRSAAAVSVCVLCTMYHLLL